MQSASERDIRRRLPQIVDAVREVTALEFVNGGGTGSLARTAAAGVVTELTAGSGLLRPGALRPLSLARPDARRLLRACRSSAAPPRAWSPPWAAATSPRGAAGPDRLPQPYLPEGLQLDKQEGAGEVQTPLLGMAARRLRVGDRVYMRHAKAGELCERFDSLYLVEGDRIVDQVPTYRGEGRAFL